MILSNGIVSSEIFQSDTLDVCGTVSWMFSLCLGQHDKTVRSERVDSSVVQPAWKTSYVGSEAPNVESELTMRRPKEKISWSTVREVPMKHRRLRTINRVDGLFLFSSCIFLRCFVVTCLLLPLTIRLATQYIKPSCTLVCQRGYIDSVYQTQK